MTEMVIPDFAVRRLARFLLPRLQEDLRKQQTADESTQGASESSPIHIRTFAFMRMIIIIEMKGAEAMKAVIYARYSSDSQREESIDGQIRECTEYAE